MSKKILTFGTFDHFHPGHHSYLEQAAAYGDQLYVVIARDQTVQKLKGFLPDHSELERQKNVQAHPQVYEAVLGSLNDPHAILKKIRPDIICLGYDQKSFDQKLESVLAEKGLTETKIIRLKPHQPQKYKSSILRTQTLQE